MAYGISQYPDAREIYRKLDRLMSLPPMRIKKDAMECYLRYFNETCPVSRQKTEEAKKYIPGGAQHNLAFNYPFPLVIERS